MSKVKRGGVTADADTTTGGGSAYPYPVEVIDLPSRGLLYSESNPLSGGTVDIKYMTAREEDILTSKNLINKGIVLDKLLESIVVSDVSVDDLLVGDRNAILLSSRIMAYGSDYASIITCPECGESSEIEVDLSSLEDKDIDIPTGTNNEHTFKLPQSEKTITFKILTHGDNKKIQNEIETWNKLQKNPDAPSADMSIRYKHMILAVDGNRDKNFIKTFVKDSFTMKDLRAFRKHVADVSPGVDMTFNYNCEACDYAERISIPLGVDFFWPPSEL